MRLGQHMQMDPNSAASPHAYSRLQSCEAYLTQPQTWPWTCVYSYIYTHVCIYVYVYIHIHIQVYVYVYRSTCIYIYTYITHDILHIIFYILLIYTHVKLYISGMCVCLCVFACLFLWCVDGTDKMAPPRARESVGRPANAGLETVRV